MTMRVVDGYLYFKPFGETDKWWREKDDDDNPISKLSPDALFSLLRDASSETVRVGEEDVRGVSTVRYRLTVDRERADLGDGPREAQVDVWLDDDGLLRRVAADGDGEAFTMDFFDFGVEVDVQPPPPDQVAELDELVHEKPCAPGDERPIRVGRALEALRAHGFDVTSEEQCLAGRVGQLTNLSGDVDDLDALIRDDGYLTCEVLVTDDLTTHTLTLGPSAGSGADSPRVETRALRNLQCTLMLAGAKGKAHLERLDAALAELKRAVGP